MMKRPFILVYIMCLIALLTQSCNLSVQNKDTDQPSTNDSVKSFPYQYLTSKKEVRQNDGSYNEMSLYLSGPQINIDTLKMFCKMKKDSITDGYFHIITFFIDKKHARFTEYPVTSMYGMDAEPAKYIKADYTYNRINGYSKLTVYDKNSWESKPIEYDVN